MIPYEFVQHFSSICACLSGGASMPVEVLKKFEYKVPREIEFITEPAEKTARKILKEILRK